MIADNIELVHAELFRLALTAPERLRIVTTTAKGPKSREYEFRMLGPGRVELVNGEGEVYVVDKYRCQCSDSKYRKRPGGCRHMVGLRQLGFFDTPKEQEHEQREVSRNNGSACGAIPF